MLSPPLLSTSILTQCYLSPPLLSTSILTQCYLSPPLLSTSILTQCYLSPPFCPLRFSLNAIYAILTQCYPPPSVHFDSHSMLSIYLSPPLLSTSIFTLPEAKSSPPEAKSSLWRGSRPRFSHAWGVTPRGSEIKEASWDKIAHVLRGIYLE